MMPNLLKQDKCIKCTRKFLSERQLQLSCIQCSSSLHLKCTGLSKQSFSEYKKGKKDFVCLFCRDYKCIRCAQHVYDRQEGVFCDGCQLWIHRKCANLTKDEYKELTTSQNEDPWYCKNCKRNMFPFYDLNDLKIKTLFKSNIRKKQNGKTKANKCKNKLPCNVCGKINKKPEKSVLCTTCSSHIHRKCSRLKPLELLEIKSNKYASWECVSCLQHKFPFTFEDDTFFSKETFNSNFQCKCQSSTDYEQGDVKYTFNYKSVYKDKTFNNINDTNDQMFDNFILQPNFKFYQNHDFHKLSEKLNKNKDFSIFHTNICSLQGNFENLHNLLADLEFSFSVIAVSETWTPESKKNQEKPHLEGYQPYRGIKGKTLKSGCGFYIRNDVKYKVRSDLNISYCDEDNEFQGYWIEILNDKKPNIIIGVYYRHPKKTSNNIFLDKLKENLGKIKNKNKTTIITGDFNYDILKFEFNKTIANFLNLMYSNFLQPTILEPTRIVSNNRPSLIDNIFINTYDKPIHSGNFINKISDHMPNFVIVRDIFEKLKTKKIKIRDMKNFDDEKYLHDLEEIKNIDLMKYENVNDMYNAFHDKYVEIIDKNAPYKTLSKKESKLKSKPWITKSILQSIKIRDKYQKKYIRKQENFWYERYRYYRNKINMLIRKSKKNYLRKFFQKNFKTLKKDGTK